MRARSQVQAAAPESNASSPSSAKCHEELDREERVTPTLLVHQSRQRLSAIPIAVQGIGHESAHIVEPERRKHDSLHTRSGLMDCINGAHQRMRGAHLVVPVCADQQEVPHFGLGD